MPIRPVRSVSGTRSALEGAGVRLECVFGFGDTSLTAPFLIMNDFRVRNHYVHVVREFEKYLA